jgi:hypothetical protein
MATDAVTPDLLGAAEALNAATPTTTTNTSSTTVETPGTETTAVIDGGETTVDGGGETTLTTESQPNEGDGTNTTAAGSAPGMPVKGSQVTEYLKAQLAASPENKAVLQSLRDAYFKHGDYEKIFGSVKDARELQNFLNGVAGITQGNANLGQVTEALGRLTNFQQNVLASDQKLYSGSPEVIENIVSDLKDVGRIDALGKLGIPFLQALAREDNKGYWNVASTLITSEMRSAGFHDVYASIFESLQRGDVKAAQAALGSLGRWYNELDKLAQNAAQPDGLSAERQAFEKERAEFANQKTNEWRTGVYKEAEGLVTKHLSKSFAPFLKLPFFKALASNKPALQALGKDIRAAMHDRLQNDKTFQSAMKGFWGQKNPDKAAILQYTGARIESIADQVVRDTVNLRYPMWAQKGGNGAAGRVAGKTTVAGQVAPNPSGPGNSPATATYVAQRPSRDAIDFTAQNAELEMIKGRARLKGTSKWVTWRKPYAPEVRG